MTMHDERSKIDWTVISTSLKLLSFAWKMEKKIMKFVITISGALSEIQIGYPKITIRTPLSVSSTYYRMTVNQRSSNGNSTQILFQENVTITTVAGIPKGKHSINYNA